MKRTLIALVAALFAWAATVQGALACPFCREALGGQNDMARGYFWSILLMLFTPLGILTGLGIYFYLLVRRARAGAEVSPPPVPQGALPPEVLVPVKQEKMAAPSGAELSSTENEPESVGV